MDKVSSFIVWQPVLTDHQASTFEALSAQAEVPVIAYVVELEDAIRRRQGWTDIRTHLVQRKLIPPRNRWLYCYRELRAHRDAVHIFCSAFQEPVVMGTLFMAWFLRVRFYLVSEPYAPVAQSYFGKRPTWVDRLKALARPWVYRVYASSLKHRMGGIFAISALAVRQYRAAGVASEKLFPFGYFIPSIPLGDRRERATGHAATLRLVFVGSLIVRKGLDILIDAVRAGLSAGHSITLDVFGPGDPAGYLFDAKHIRYCGQIPFGQTQRVVADYDLLVLPSRYDGWGVVVNEALCAGVPVVCSDKAGASVLVQKFSAGAVFSSGDVNALARLLCELSATDGRLGALQAGARNAARAIQPRDAASYMLKVLGDVQRPAFPVADTPWYPEPP